MGTDQSDLKTLLAEIAAREKRAVGRAWLYTGTALLVAALWLSLTAYKTIKLSNQAANLNANIAEKTRELANKNAQLDEKTERLKKISSILELTPDELITLYNFGYGKKNIDRKQLELSLQADSARQQIASDTSNSQRTDIKVEYFLKDVEKDKVENALKELGFQVDIKNPVNDLPTNAIWFGQQVSPEDVKLVAFTLMRAGVQLKTIRHFKANSLRANSSLIQVGADPGYVKAQALTVEEIRNATQFGTDQ